MLADHSDTAGIRPCDDARPSATYYGNLSITDSHSVNLLLNKFTATGLLKNEFHIGSLCTQHRVGSTCEEVSKRLGLVPPCFCLCRQLGWADFHNDLTEATRAVLSKYLLRRTASGPVADVDHAAASVFVVPGQDLETLARELLELCYVQPHVATQDGDMSEDAVQRRREQAKEFLRFFPPPWTGYLIHPCGDGCCIDRADSVNKGTGVCL